MKYPNNIKSLKKARGWKIDQAAEAMGMSRGGYIKVERGENRLTSTSIANAARAFGVKESEIVSSEEPVAKIPRKRTSNVVSEAAPPHVASPESAAAATVGIPSTGTFHNQAQTETPESQIVREVAEVTVRKVWGYLEHTDPMPDEFFAVVRSSIADYVAQKVRERRRSPMDRRIQTEVEDHKDDKASERG